MVANGDFGSTSGSGTFSKRNVEIWVFLQ